MLRMEAPSSEVGAETPDHPKSTGLLVLLGVALLSTAPFVPLPGYWFVVLGLASVTGISLALRAGPAAHLGLLGTLTLAISTVPQLHHTWPSQLVIAIGLYLLIARLTPLRDGLTWLRVGSIDRTSVLLGLGFVLLSSSALVLWTWIFQPDLSGPLARVEGLHPALLLLGGLAFASVNALAEEVLWRGVMMEGLQTAIGPVVVVLGVQALSFGLMHIRGFPSGWVGVGLAAIYGLMMGLIRTRSDGLLAPWLTHVFADATIFAIVVTIALAA